MEFVLPQQAYVQKFISKSKFFDKAAVSTKLKKEFTDKIQKIMWKYKLAGDTIGVPKTDKVEEIQIFEIQLKEQTIPKNALKIIDKAIPYPILYIFIYEEHIAYGITLKEDNSQSYYFSEWDEEITFNFTGIDLEKVYQGIIKKFIKNINVENKEFATIVDTDKRIKILGKEINILKSKVKNEKQFNKKVELNKTLQIKKKDLVSLT